MYKYLGPADVFEYKDKRYIRELDADGLRSVLIPITKAEAEHHERAGGHIFQEVNTGKIVENDSPRPVAPPAAPLIVAETVATGGDAKTK